MDKSIIEFVNKFHEILIEVLPEFGNPLCTKISSRFEQFPYGCCMNTSVLLANVLKNICNIQTQLMADDQYRHYYLEYKGYILDLTARQLDKTLPNVLIIPISEKPMSIDFGRTYIIKLWSFGEGTKIYELQKRIEKELSSCPKSL